MAPIHISDPETDRLIRVLATHRSMSLTEAIKLAVENQLRSDGQDITKAPDHSAEKSNLEGVEKLFRELDAEVRSTTLDYTRLRAKAEGKRPGTRIYKMLAEHGLIETLGLLVKKPTDGLRLLIKHKRPELSAEAIVLKSKYAPIMPADVRSRAAANLREVGLNERFEPL
jgi:hypothetical protein